MGAPFLSSGRSAVRRARSQIGGTSLCGATLSPNRLIESAPPRVRSFCANRLQLTSLELTSSEALHPLENRRALGRQRARPRAYSEARVIKAAEWRGARSASCVLRNSARMSAKTRPISNIPNKLVRRETAPRLWPCKEELMRHCAVSKAVSSLVVGRRNKISSNFLVLPSE